MGRVTPYTEEEKAKRREQDRLRSKKRYAKVAAIKAETKVVNVKPKKTTNRMQAWLEQQRTCTDVYSLLPDWRIMKSKNCKNTFHAILHYEDEEDIEKQNQTLMNMNIRVFCGCKCEDRSNKKKSLHFHRHMILFVEDDRLSNLFRQSKKDRFDAEWKKAFTKGKMIKITCEFHLKNVIHYVHCLKSQDVRDRKHGGFIKGTHIHHEFFNSYPDILHEPCSCGKIQNRLEKLLEPQHDFMSCVCPKGFYCTQAQSFIRSLPRIQSKEGDAFYRQIHEIRAYKKMLIQHLNIEGKKEDSVQINEYVPTGSHYEPSQARIQELELRILSLIAIFVNKDNH